MLHVLNGDSTRMGLERSGIPGTIIVWPDVLYEGPTPLATGEAWIQTRARYLGSLVVPPDPAVVERYRKDDAALEAFRDHDEVVFWLEHDLYDQLLLIRHLWWLGERVHGGGAERSGLRESVRVGGGGPESCRPDLSGPASPRLSLVCRDVYLGQLQPEQFPPLFAARQPITAAQIETGSKVWRAFCAADPTVLAAFAREETEYEELPYLRAALLRHLEEFPSAANGLSRTESQMLRVLQDGPLTFGRAFRASTDLEERMFMGDLSFWQIAKMLASAPHPLVTIDPAPGRAPGGTLTITDTGRGVFASRADQIELNGIDRWLGGVHLTSDHCYRWNGRELLRS